MAIGDKIAFHRRKCKMTQEVLAEKLNVSRQSVYKWEANISLPKIEKLYQLTSILSIDYNELLEEEKKECKKK